MAKVKSKPTARRLSKAKRERLAELREQAKRSGDRLRLMKKSLPQLTAAEEELRQHAAKWVAAIHQRIASLSAEVNSVLGASRPGEVLNRVFDVLRLAEVGAALNEADCEAATLTIRNYDMPIPHLLAHRDYVCDKLFPLAAEGAKLFADESEGGK